MDEVLTALVEKLPVEFLIVFLACSVVLLVIVGTWVFSHVRVDKQGRRYWYSQKYEDAKCNKKQDAAMAELRSVRLDLMKLQILSTELAPNTRMAVFDVYRKLGGNSYIDEYVRARVAPLVESHTAFIKNSDKRGEI